MTEAQRIGAVAKRCGVSRDTLRFYERQRLLSAPRRSASGYRLYREDDVERVLFVRRAQAIGLSLDDIRELLGARLLRSPEQCRRVGVRLKARIEAVEHQIAQLQAFREELAENLKRCRQAESEAKCCPVVLNLTGKRGAIALGR